MPAPYDMADLLRVMERLRDPDGGCPWDLAQDFPDIVPSTLEECYELAEAIEQGDYPHVGEELGDLLFQVIFYAQLGRERGYFDFGDVVHTLVEKLVRRHPHVFADGEIEGRVDGPGVDQAQVRQSWESIKQSEREAKARGGILDDVPLALPALSRAQKLQKRAAGVGFDWQSPDGVFAKLEEELSELREAVAAGDGAGTAAELGDLVFTCINLARHLEVDAEAATRAAGRRFEGRFRHMERLAAEADLSLEAMDGARLESLWERAKALETDS